VSFMGEFRSVGKFSLQPQFLGLTLLRPGLSTSGLSLLR